MPSVRVTRPIAVDVRVWAKTTMEALNKAGVGVGEDFLISPISYGGPSVSLDEPSDDEDATADLDPPEMLPKPPEGLF